MNILESLAEGSEKLSTGLRHLMVISAHLKCQEVYDWSKRELEGYKEQERVPDYRKTEGYVEGDFHDGARVVTFPIHIEAVDAKNAEIWSKPALREGVDGLESMVGHERLQIGTGRLLLTRYSEILNRHYQAQTVIGVRNLNCIATRVTIPGSAPKECLGAIRTAALELALTWGMEDQRLIGGNHEELMKAEKENGESLRKKGSGVVKDILKGTAVGVITGMLT